MKKLLGILVLGLLWCNVGFAEDIYLSCIAFNGKAPISIVFNDETRTLIVNGNHVKAHVWNERIIKWGDYGYQKIDRITGAHGDHHCSKTSKPIF